ncbi:hypothetical protein BOTBODRAFT_170623 [Botryobasidium botryosum FD-172 SS1]|uniref:FAD-binding domain-containing protein n=1 Tax=Botryobasidium botryosum (strain FD-172 SS1) TaxID=930990 RepID=A0A067MUV9_BOTB1|nr:hypothetical protein BOTBODRAFT_170623 [Botryobasidium botryosum FD-172 SS1]
MLSIDAPFDTIKLGETAKLYGGRKAGKCLNITIVGCGLGGLAAAFTLAKAGHNVTILESASKIGEIGAGIQVSPNISRILISWGLGPELEKYSVCPEGFVFRRWDTGEQVGFNPTGALMTRTYNAPYLHIHRADFHKIFYDLAVGAGVKIRLSSRVVTLDPSAPSVILATGETLSADLIIGADGVKSMVRDVVVGRPDKPVPTGDAAYRATVPAELMLKEPDLAHFIEYPMMTAWMGPGKHIVAYCIRAQKLFNLVILHPDNATEESWTQPGSVEKMREEFAGWEPRVQKILSLIPSTYTWRLMDRRPLETWIHPGNKVVLLGDSCHPMLPYRAQGAAMAIEDGVVLGDLLSRIPALSALPTLLKAYQELRLARATATQLASRENQHIFHLPDGPEQQARDANMREVMMRFARKTSENQDVLEIAPEAEKFDGKGCLNTWADRKKNDIQFGYNANAEVDKYWAQKGQMEVEAAVAAGSAVSA